MNRIQEIIDWIRDIEMSQIINFVIAIAIIIIISLLSSLISYGLLKIFFRKQEKEKIKSSSIYKAIKTFIIFLGIYISSKIIELEQYQNEFIDKCFIIVIIWTIARIVAGIFEVRELLIDKLTKGESNRRNAFFTTVVGKIVKIVLYIIAGYLTLKQFNYDIGGIATGLGLTGALVALATQDLIKQILSGLSIFADKPFEVGDWIEIGEISGTVEDITIRSTKVRTIEDTMVTVPNDLITSSNVINWGEINKRVFRSNLKFALETEERIIEKIINRIKFILKYNEDIIRNSINVQVLNIEESAIDIDIYLETTITNYIEYRNFCNKINLTILNILETQNVKLSYPGRNVYIKENKENEENKDKKSVKPVKIRK